MAEIDRARRRFLATSALAGLGLATAGKAARAFTEQKMNVELHKAYMNACTGAADPYHQALAAEEAAKLRATMSEAEVERAIAAMRCPICGCSLIAAGPPAAAAPAKTG
jgi:hypothetical protein